MADFWPANPCVVSQLVHSCHLGKDDKFKRFMVDHQAGQYVNGCFHTNGIENFWSLLKRGIIGIFHQVSPQHLQNYCDEFAARNNTRKIKETMNVSSFTSNNAMEGLNTINSLVKIENNFSHYRFSQFDEKSTSWKGYRW